MLTQSSIYKEYLDLMDTEAWKYTMHNIFSNFLCFASLFAHLSSILNNFNCNDENWILGK